MSSTREKITKEFKKKSNWLSEAKARKESRAWREMSFAISIKILRYLRTNKISQKTLAESLEWSPQHLSKVLKGKENLTLDTICKLQKATGLSLIQVPKSVNERKYQKPQKKKVSKLRRLELAYRHTETFAGPKHSTHTDANIRPINRAV